jgi:hypothetical protein
VTKNLPKIALIILNHNGKHILDETLASSFNQSYPNLKIYVADSASVDGSLEYLAINYPKAIVLSSKEDLGITGICNFAANLINDCDYYVFLSNDILLDKHCIKELVTTVTSNPNAGIVTSVMIKYGQKQVTTNPIDSAGYSMDLFGFISPNNHDLPFNSLSKSTFETYASCGTSFIISRKLFHQIGGFDNKFWGFSDDIDLSWRVRLLGYKVLVNPKSHVYHHQSVTLSKNKRSRNRFLSEKNILRMLLKNYSLLSLLTIIPLYIILELAEILFFTIMFQPHLAYSIIRAIYWNVSNLQNTLYERNKIQNLRRVSDLSILKKIFWGSYKVKIIPLYIKSIIKVPKPAASLS